MKVAIFYPCDPLGFVPSGIDTFVRGILKWAPVDIEFSLYGATSHPEVYKLGSAIEVAGVFRPYRFVPITVVNANAKRSVIPLIVRYAASLFLYQFTGRLKAYNILDFHRIEPVFCFSNDKRHKNLYLHQDMSVIRTTDSDIKWRYFPRLYEFFEKKAFSKFSHVYCVRRSAAERYSEEYKNAKQMIEHIPTWVDTQIFSPKENNERNLAQRASVRFGLGLPDSAPVIVFVGRLDQQKDPFLLLKTFKKASLSLQGLHMIIVGNGALHSKVLKFAVEIGAIETVRFVGAQTAEAIADILMASDLFLLTSKYEGMPIAVLEALAMGVPVVSTNVGEIRQVIVDGINGYVAEARDADTLAQYVVRAINNIDSLRGKECIKSIQPFFAEQVLGHIYQNYRSQHTF